MTGGKRLGTAFIALLVVASVAIPAAAAMVGQSAINEQADAAHNPYIDAEVTKSVHKMGWGPRWYEGDNGETQKLPAEVNATQNNPYHIVTSDINASAYGEFPRKDAESGDNDASALDASEWTTSTSDSTNVTPSTSDVTTAPGVDAVEVNTSGGMGSGDTATFTYSNFSITSDAEKRYVQLVADVNTLDSATHVDIRIVDADGDYVNATIDTSENSSTGNTMGNATGEGLVFQRQVGAMTVYGSGDGTMGELQKVEIVFSDGDANIDFAAINAEKMGEWDFGTQKVDTDSDSSLETKTIREVNTTGQIELTDVDTMGTAFDSATLHDLMIPMHFHSSMMPTDGSVERWNVSYNPAEEFAGFETRLDDYRRLMLPSAYDLSYASVELKDDVEVPDSRYQQVRYATSVGTTNFSDISSWTDATSSYSSIDSNVTLISSGISAGEEIALNYDYVVTADEKNALQSTSGGGAPMAGSEGGIFSSLTGSIASLFGGILVALGLKKKAGA